MGEEKEKREAVVLSGISLYNGHVGSALEHPISGAPYFAWCFQRSILFWSNRRPFPGQGEGEPTANHGGVEGGGPAEKGCVDLAASANRGQQMRVVFSEMDGQAPRMVFFFCSESVPHFLRGDRRPHCTCRSLRVPASAQTPAQHPHPSSDSLLIQLLINPVMTLNPVLAVHCLRCSTSAATPMPRRGS